MVNELFYVVGKESKNDKNERRGLDEVGCVAKQMIRKKNWISFYPETRDDTVFQFSLKLPRVVIYISAMKRVSLK